MFAARFEAGQRGADNIGINDFIIGLILEDQNTIGSLMENALPDMHQRDVIVRMNDEVHSPFFAPEVAGELLTQIRNLLPQSRPIGLSTEIPLSSELKRVFGEADNVRKIFHHNRIEPLHLLALILREKSSDSVELLRKAGITEESVLKILKAAPGDS